MKGLLSPLASLFRWGGTARYGFAPYSHASVNRQYNALFCDKPAVMRAEFNDQPQGDWSTLLAKEPYRDGLKPLASDPAKPSRVRLAACNRLRELGETEPTRELLATVIEVRLPDGLDVLAIYSDGNVRYIHHKEVGFKFEPAPDEWRPTIERLLDASRAAVSRIGPWLQPRIAPPTEGMVRMTFLVTDGLYFGQGLLNVMDKDELAGPIIAAATQVLKWVTQKTGS